MFNIPIKSSVLVLGTFMFKSEDDEKISAYVRMEYHIFRSVLKLRRELPEMNSIANYNIIERELQQNGEERG